ncbi:MAG: ATP-binding protein [Actinobacteria bacterium]|nr:ATP-binding protein [Actinomycetota bacterium]
MSVLRLAVHHLEDGLVLGRGAAWGYVRVPTVTYGLLSESEREALLVRVAGGLAGLRDTECHLLVATRSYPVRPWADALRFGAASAARGWDDYVEAMRAHVQRGAFWGKEVYLGVRLGHRRRRGPKRLRGRQRPSPPRVREEEVERWRAAAADVARLLAIGGLDARPAQVDELRWLVERALWRGVGEPPLRVAHGPWSGDALVGLASGTLQNGRRSLTVEQVDGRGHVAFLVPARFPARLPFPGGEWLHHPDGLGFPVEASIRLRIVPANSASADAARKLAEASDQMRHITGTSAEPPIALLETAEEARQLEHSLTRDGVPLVYSWPRLTVAAPGAEELEARIVQLVEAYRDLGVDLVRPTGNQLSLFLESFPGDRLRFHSYEQRQALTTLAGSMFVATSEVGDRRGPYIGSTTGRGYLPVHFDPLEAAQRNLPPAIAVTGQPGAGKTSLANLLTYQLALRGTCCLLIDPKNEASGLARLPGLDRVRVLRLGAADDGLLDPFSVANDPDAATLLALDVLRLLLPDSAAHETALLHACREESRSVRPSLRGVARRLRSSADGGTRQLESVLGLYADLPLARLCFAPADRRPPTLDEGLTILQLQGLTLPDAATDREDHTVADRLALAVMFMVTAFARRLTETADAPAKAVVLDEAWMLTATRQGRALVERLARTGRSTNAVLVLVTQNAGDLLDETITNNLSARFAFRSSPEEEVQAVLRLVGVEPTAEHAAAVRTLATGECLFADLDGRVETMWVDLALPELLAAFDTTPRALVEVGR